MITLELMLEADLEKELEEENKSLSLFFGDNKSFDTSRLIRAHWQAIHPREPVALELDYH